MKTPPPPEKKLDCPQSHTEPSVGFRRSVLARTMRVALAMKMLTAENIGRKRVPTSDQVRKNGMRLTPSISDSRHH